MTTCHAKLMDGTAVSLRRLTGDDRKQVMSLLDSLSEEERYLRFFTIHPSHLGEWVDAVVGASADRFTLGAFQSGALAGMANYIQTARPGYAEIAIVVAHGQHHRGVGTALLVALARTARDRGQHHLIADVLVANHEMLKVLDDSGWRCARHLDGSVFTIEVDLTRREASSVEG